MRQHCWTTSGRAVAASACRVTAATVHRAGPPTHGIPARLHTRRGLLDGVARRLETLETASRWLMLARVAASVVAPAFRGLAVQSHVAHAASNEAPQRACPFWSRHPRPSDRRVTTPAASQHGCHAPVSDMGKNEAPPRAGVIGRQHRNNGSVSPLPQTVAALLWDASLGAQSSGIRRATYRHCPLPLRCPVLPWAV